MRTGFRSIGGIVLLGMLVRPACGDGPTRSEIAKIGKAATALVEAGPNAQGTAFCIHPDGFFVTNAHVVKDNRAPSLFMNSGQKSQKMLLARVIRADAELDLALLQVTGAPDLPALTLGSDETLAELAEVVAFGYPFGTGLAVGKQEKPAISVNVGSVTSLRNKDGVLHRIQLDAVLNPGNSGGPVLDKEGKVVGVVVSGLRGAGVNFAVPVSHLSKFVARPEFVFEPPSIALDRVHDPTEFQVRAISLLPANKKAFDLEFYLFVDGKRARKFHMDLKDGVHRVRTEPIPKPSGPAVLRLAVIFDEGEVRGQVVDRAVRLAPEVKLSAVRRLVGPKNRAFLHDGKVVRGDLKNLEDVPVNLGSASVNLNLLKAKEVRIERPSGLAGLGCTIVAFQDDREIGRFTHALNVEGLPAPGDEAADLDIVPPQLAKDKEVREIEAPIHDLAVAGGGRYLILHLPNVGKLAIFDVNEAKVVTTLPAPEDNLKFAGGLEKLVVALPGAKTLQRWDLSTFKMEASAPLEVNGELHSISMGAASRGPIVGSYRENNSPWVKFVHWQLDSLERRAAVMEGNMHPSTMPYIRSSADGRSMGIWSRQVSPTGVTWIRWDGQIGKVSYEHNSRGHVVPGPDGKVLFTGIGMFRSVGFPNQAVPYPNSDSQGVYVPALSGDYYLHLGRVAQPRLPNKDQSAEPALTIYKRDYVLPVLKRTDLDIPPANTAVMQFPPNLKADVKNELTLDKRVLLIPQAKLLITVPASNQLVLHRIDLEEAIAKAGGLGKMQAAALLRPVGDGTISLVSGQATVEGQLADTDPKDTVRTFSFRKVYTIKMQAGKTYQIDHRSRSFDAYLRLEDDGGRQLAADDDSGGNLDARIVFRCPVSGSYRIIATSLQGGAGPFTLTINER